MKFEIFGEKLILKEADRVEFNQLKLHFKRRIKNWRYDFRVQRGLWDGFKSLFKDKTYFNIGLWKEVYELCKLNGWKFEVINKEKFPLNKDITIDDIKETADIFFKDENGEFRKNDKDEKFYPYDYQIEAAYKIIKNRYCSIEAGTGAGKSLVFGLVYFHLLRQDPSKKFLLIVPYKTLTVQMYDDLKLYADGKLDLRIEEVHSDSPRKDENPSLIIGTAASLVKYDKEYFKQFHMVCIDEAHALGPKNVKDNENHFKMVNTILKNTFDSATIRFGMSGTYPKKDTLEWLNFQAHTGPIVLKIQTDELVELGTVSPFKIKSIILNHCDPDFAKDLSLVRKGHNGRIIYEIERSYVHNSTKRLNFIVDTILQKCDKNTIILFNIKDYGKLIRDTIVEKYPDKEVYYIDGDIKNKKRKEIIKEMEEGTNKVLVGSAGCLSTGVSIKNLHYMILAESGKSEQKIIQSIGRTIRLHDEKDRALIFDLVDIFDEDLKRSILFRHYIERRSFYKDRKYPYDELKINLV